ncbi:probable ubiquitin-conjugating enzyme E2 24 [Ziziphus jujuba]|uniref:E2 ubiquitin-conjugating enzyme n=1 Tax=Ziziphus jujuba TaxID=326968 RepID=A0A6P6GD74_ZIZJJ|nr:probable ubiquitin-conjugating enzyme E2 24 [Ziziphus jujuba]XP_024931608.1 probable ubiquitin-conjugating enzyme E2 24 [Ziziphus jujuba]XP_024931610.1 probable ubiquitin-conjugating enzyme E2 24 [Ziziphus jujuba]
MMDMLLSDSDWESSSELGSVGDQEEIEHLYSGQALSILSSLEESIGKIDDFLSFERGFMHGDMVCSGTDPSGQMGRVISIDMLVDLENVQGEVLRDVNSKKLSKIRSISMGDYVVCGPWLGRVDKVVDRLTVVFDDGTKCEVTAMDRDKILPISPNILEDPQYPYYPGQRLQIKLSTVSNSAGWLCGTWKENQDEGTVCAVEVGLVYVDWLASVLTGYESDLPAPPRVLDSKKLTSLSCFLHATWQLGDWCLLSISDRKAVEEKGFRSASTHELIIKKHKKLESEFRRRNLSSNVEEIFVIVKTKTKVDVIWQDGSITLGLDSKTLLPVNVANAHDFWPEQFVMEKAPCDDPHVSSKERWGVVQCVDAKERTVKVQWKTVTTPEDEELMVETVSAYELVEHPDFSFCFGDLVFRLVPDKVDGHVVKDCLNTEIVVGQVDTFEGKNCGSDTNECPDKCFLSSIGNVTGFRDGAVEVKWATGITSKVAPYDILRIDKSEGSAAVASEGGVQDLNEEITDDKHFSQKGKGLLNSDAVGEGCNNYPWSSSFFFPQAAIGFFTSIATSLLGSFGSTSLGGTVPYVHVSEVEKESGISNEKQGSETSELCLEPHPISKLEIYDEKRLDEEGNEIQWDKDLPHTTADKNPNKFRQFDMVPDCLDHHFLEASKGPALSQVRRSWLKKVQDEWNILQKNLPETIYVRAFEERMDLIRAAIVGSPGTPYHDGLFFFDIYLPSEYPHEPPMVHYISGGLRVNPNLYESGKVCLSLLNTWTGRGTEVWNPGSSTILQVLLSLQALVLNEKPYFNEAGYDQQIGRTEGEKNSVSYNENAYLVTCKSMIYLLRKPPKNFEVLVEEHFSQRSENILMACQAYMEGAPVGCAAGFSKTENEHQTGGSTGFKIMVGKLFVKFLEVFSEKGINCSQFK